MKSNRACALLPGNLKIPWQFFLPNANALFPIAESDPHPPFFIVSTKGLTKGLSA
jgi:hypothetical protein